MRVRFVDGRGGAARVVTADERRDLALLQVGVANTPAAPLRDARALRPAKSVLAAADHIVSGPPELMRVLKSLTDVPPL